MPAASFSFWFSVLCLRGKRTKFRSKIPYRGGVSKDSILPGKNDSALTPSDPVPNLAYTNQSTGVCGGDIDTSGDTTAHVVLLPCILSALSSAWS
ncbi:hypothetical protein CALVIDRAFT_92779 [Calocera viscosa TUFC12733]|uniref:Uncharacterized protein n=1 Tax=Calocera viscosa (strain TUFC12733) TaxID=1330018 RepID=A0A167MV11_CALVF|nr:hypothetical protein CALVIDRAFT_92779 [Calocera viscosa TUFC12733]